MAPVPLLFLCKVFARLTAWEKGPTQKRPLPGNSWSRRKQQKYCNGRCFFAQIG